MDWSSLLLCVCFLFLLILIFHHNSNQISLIFSRLRYIYKRWTESWNYYAFENRRLKKLLLVSWAKTETNLYHRGEQYGYTYNIGSYINEKCTWKLLCTIEDLDKWLSQKHTIIHKAKAKFRLIDSPHWQDYLPINYFLH